MARNRIAFWLTAAMIVAFMSRPVHLAAQLGALSSRAQAPQAKSQQELDQYLRIITDTSPQTVLADVKIFSEQFPGSELLGTAWQYQMHAYEQIGDFQAMLLSGQQALKVQPDNLNTLLTLAPAVANQMFKNPSDTQLAVLAEEYAHRALEAIEKTRPPRQTTLEQWMTQKKTMQADMHEVLGLVALKQSQLSAAIEELQTAVQLSPTPQGSRYLRLALAYAAKGDIQNAQENFQKAIQLGPEPVRQLASEEMRKLSQTKQ